jgi:hypothetical protein
VTTLQGIWSITPIDDTQHGPCNQSDIRECQPYSEDPNSSANVPQYEGAEEDDDALLAAELGDDYADGHFGGEYRQQEEETTAKLDEEQMLSERVAELEAAAGLYTLNSVDP